jgi:hypothetical protein
MDDLRGCGRAFHQAECQVITNRACRTTLESGKTG